MKAFIIFIWQLPQHVVAMALCVALKCAGRIQRKEKLENNNIFPENILYTVRVKGWGVSLGRYIFLDEDYGLETVKHERGHSVQSRRWGPLYLLVIGIPSAVFNNLWDRLTHKNWTTEQRHRWYYSRYPEKQADKLGGVIRPWAEQE